MLNPADDAYIRNASYSDILANSNELLVGRVASMDWIRSVLRFDISSIPDNATITSATLTIRANDSGSNSSGDDLGPAGFQLFHLTTDADFTNGGNFSYNDNSWGADKANGGTDDVLWTTAGGIFDPTALSTIAAIPLTTVIAGDQFTFATVTGFTSAIAANLGDDSLQLLFRIPALEGSTTATRKLLRFASGENTGVGYKPLLTVNYDVVPEPSPSLLSALSAAALLTLRRRSQ